MRRVHHYTEAEARDFFERLQVYTDAYLAAAIPQIRGKRSSNYYEDWTQGHPIGSVLHWNGGVSFAGMIRFFILNHVASSHAVVGKSLDPRFAQLRRDLKLEADLRAEVCQIVPPDKVAWHAGWANRFTYGIECRNAGVLRAEPRTRKIVGEVKHPDLFSCRDLSAADCKFFWWPSAWTTPFQGEVVKVNGVWHETWSRGQLATVVTLLRYLSSLHPGALDPVWMLAHHQVEATKSDVVLPVPLHELRHAVLFSDQHVDDLEWLASGFDDVEEVAEEDVDDPWMLREMGERQGDRAEEDLYGFTVDTPISGAVDAPEEGVESLRRLGFWLGSGRQVDADALRRSVRVYQRGHRLDVDGKLNRATLAMLDRDLRAWRIR